MKNRGWHRLRAWIGGYFWAACPVCGQMFGGHEAVKGGMLIERRFKNGASGPCTCPDCPGYYEKTAKL